MARFTFYIEIPLIISAFGAVLSAVVYTNFIIYRTCYVDLGYNQSDCALLGNVNNNVTEKLETLVEPTVTIINTVKSTVESVIAIIVCMLIGPWSDKFGRKPVLIVGFVGSVISSVLVFITSCFPYISSWYIICCSLPSIIAGGGPASMAVFLSYIVDTTSPENRGIRLAIIELIFAVASIIGNVASSFIFNAVGYTGIFAISSLGSILSGLYGIFILPESVENTEQEGKIKEFFNIANIKEMMHTSFKKRENFDTQIIILMFLFTVISSLGSGEAGLTFLFLRAKFGWTLQKYTLYSSATIGISIFGVLFGISFLHKRLSVTESVLMLMGLLSSLNGTLLQGLATSSTYIYVAGVARCLGGVVSPMSKSLLSKLVPSQEIGKLFTMMMICNFLFGLGSSPMFNLLYKNTLNSNPAIYNFVHAGFGILNIFIVIAIMVLQFLSLTTYQRLGDDSSGEPVGESVNEDKDD